MWNLLYGWKDCDSQFDFKALKNVYIFFLLIVKDLKAAPRTLDIREPTDLRTNTSLPKITNQMHLKILSLMQGPDNDTEVKVKIHHINILKSDLVRLSKELFLNDSIIEASLELIVRRSKTPIYRRLQKPTIFYLSTFFHSTLKQRGYKAADKFLRGEDIFQYDLIIGPVHLPG